MFLLYALVVAAGLAACLVGLAVPFMALTDTRLGGKARLFITATNVG